ncbi:MAG: type I-C CRISPR-associated protein Cas5 [Pirellulaceae bacterium]|nr:type I-C CRISPR-associated protein Cas5 [Pirellulaceae bacterium]
MIVPNSLPQAIEVWGDFACFSMPAAKAERFSYAAPTPSAVRGIFDSIYCKPQEFRWQVDRIEILKPIRYIALRRNETKEKASERAIQSWMKGTAEPEPIMADADASYWGTDQRGRTQRQTMALRDVRYRLTAHVVARHGFEDRVQGIESQFRRRASHGKCVWQPSFGCREMPAYFRLIEPGETLASPVPISMDLGWMLYDVFDLAADNHAPLLKKNGWKTVGPAISVFQATIHDGVLDVPPYHDKSVRRAIDKEVGHAS